MPFVALTMGTSFAGGTAPPSWRPRAWRGWARRRPPSWRRRAPRRDRSSPAGCPASSRRADNARSRAGVDLRYDVGVAAPEHDLVALLGEHLGQRRPPRARAQNGPSSVVVITVGAYTCSPGPRAYEKAHDPAAGARSSPCFFRSSRAPGAPRAAGHLGVAARARSTIRRTARCAARSSPTGSASSAPRCSSTTRR